MVTRRRVFLKRRMKIMNLIEHIMHPLAICCEKKAQESRNWVNIGRTNIPIYKAIFQLFAQFGNRWDVKRTFLAKIGGPPGQREQPAAPPACHRSAHNGNNLGGQVGCGESNPLWVTQRYNTNLARFYLNDMPKDNYGILWNDIAQRNMNGK